MGEQILTDIRLYPDAEGVTVVGDDVVEEGPEHVADDHRCHHQEEGAVQLVWQHVIQCTAGHKREGQIDGGNAQSTQHVNGK